MSQHMALIDMSIKGDGIRISLTHIWAVWMAHFFSVICGKIRPVCSLNNDKEVEYHASIGATYRAPFFYSDLRKIHGVSSLNYYKSC